MSDWQRLGDALIAARVRLGYPRRADFQRARGLSHSRTLLDLENAKRTNYDRATLIQAEQWYGLAPGNISEILAGGSARYAHPNPADEREGSARVDPTFLVLEFVDDLLQGLTPTEVREVQVEAESAIFRKVAEIRERHTNVVPMVPRPGPGVQHPELSSVTRYDASQPPDVDSPESRAVARKTGRKPHGGGRAGDDPDG